ncbi:MAG: isoprenylcysteine carboxylmethyltransferase family protein [Candidatus Eisenbacteria bacterium]|uniref:methanethiol S-methyltransferase n=1 Tax=Eiseniibacteriota bacterium TaxID=2212470 RepID=A0A956SDA6_UNCEI|nr:isoprenylcysteine carboxylmethyltransferase family protein [Candidatus Eisenbacteria bacterium]
MKRFLIFAYGIISYLMFLVTFTYAIGFIGNIGVPRAIDGVVQAPLGKALLVNLALLAVFAVQHSLMARPGFKERWTRVVPRVAERSTYVLFSNLALILLMRFWEPMGGQIWNVTATPAKVALYGVFGLGWGIVLLSTFLLNHFDLFGLRQVWLQLRGKEYTPLRFGTPLLYKTVRHPLYLGFLLGMWATPTMTLAHLVFAAMSTAYMLVAIQLEERDLEAAHPEYRNYKKQVPMLVPTFRR